MERQSAVFVNATDCNNIEQLNKIVSEILKIQTDLSPHSKTDEVESHLWHADTKYYKAEIDLTVLKKKSIMTEQFSENTEAVLLYFDSEKKCDALKTLGTWMSYVDAWEPSIKLAVCKNCDREGSNTISRVEIQEWCLEHEFELVELDPDMEDYDIYEDVGVKRIKNALLAHMWPNMIMKDPNDAVKKAPSTCAEDVAKGNYTVPNDTQKNRIDGLLGELNDDDIIGDENEEDDFEKLFSRLRVMKDQASEMPETERKKYAENMVKAFWTALGGDGEELDGLSSDEDDKKDEAAGT